MVRHSNLCTVQLGFRLGLSGGYSTPNLNRGVGLKELPFPTEFEREKSSQVLSSGSRRSIAPAREGARRSEAVRLLTFGRLDKPGDQHLTKGKHAFGKRPVQQPGLPGPERENPKQQGQQGCAESVYGVP